jgi:hypothetical protein
MADDLTAKKPIKATMPCAGCMLLKRKVFENLRYEFDTNHEGDKFTDDSKFMLSAHKANYSIYCHTGIFCKHLVTKKFIRNEDGTYSHPVWEES